MSGLVATRSVTGSKTDTPIREIPQSVSVVTRDQMDARAVQNIGQALTYSAGVVGEPYGSDPRFDSPVIRGFSAADSQYLNGLKLMRSAGVTSIEPWGLERVEVLRGPSSVLYGQGNPGGLINLVSKRPMWTSFGQAQVEGGTFDRYSAAFDVGGPVAGTTDFAYRLTGLARDSGAQQNFVDDDRYFLAPSLTWKPSNDTTFTVLASIQHDKADTPIGLPLEYTLNAATTGQRVSRNLYLGDPSLKNSSRTQANIGYEFEHRFDDGVTFRQNARYSSMTWDYDSLYYSSLDSTNPSIANRGASYNKEKFGTFTIDNQLEASFHTGPLTHTVLFGLDVRHHEVDTLAEFGTAPSINVFAPVYNQPITKNVWYNSKTDGTLNQAGIYGQDQIKLDKWILTLGLRHDWASTESTQNTNFGNSVQDQKDHAFTGRAGLSYQFDSGFAPYVSYATSFEPVLGNMPVALGGGAFKPSEGEQVEAGVKYQPIGWKGFVTAALYDLTQSNVSSTELINGINQSVQNGEVHVKGFEFSALANLAEGLDLIGNYTWTDAKYTGGQYTGSRPINVPENAASLWLFQNVKSGVFAGFGFGGGMRYVGSRYGLDGNTNLVDANTLFDAAISYQSGPYKLALNINNIANEYYVASCGSFGCYLGDGRTVTGRVTYKW